MNYREHLTYYKLKRVNECGKIKANRECTMLLLMPSIKHTSIAMKDLHALFNPLTQVSKHTYNLSNMSLRGFELESTLTTTVLLGLCSSKVYV